MCTVKYKVEVDSKTISLLSTLEKAFPLLYICYFHPQKAAKIKTTYTQDHYFSHLGCESCIQILLSSYNAGGLCSFQMKYWVWLVFDTSTLPDIAISLAFLHSMLPDFAFSLAFLHFCIHFTTKTSTTWMAIYTDHHDHVINIHHCCTDAIPTEPHTNWSSCLEQLSILWSSPHHLHAAAGVSCRL